MDCSQRQTPPRIRRLVNSADRASESRIRADRRGGTARLTLSAIIPVLSDLPALVQLLDCLDSSGNGPEQTVVIDGSASSACKRICTERQCLYLALEPNRGRQLDAGAAAASGDVLWFLHADSVPSANAADLIRRRVEAGYIGGYFGFTFTGPQSWYKKALSASINLRARIGIPYGDQGLFVARNVYHQSAGYTPTPLFEEVHLVKSLRRMGQFGPVDATIGVSPRRWERDGWVRRTLSNRLMAMAYMAGVSPQRLARYYHSTGSG